MSTEVTSTDAYTDVVELCALLQCLGFSVKSLDTSDGNMSQECGGGARTVVINCQASGLHVVLESPGMSCSCPAPSHQNSGVWQVSGVTGGKHLDKEFGCTLLGSLPKTHRDRLTAELREMIRCIKHHNESVDHERRQENKSASATELETPEKLLQEIQAETPTRYRSLDTLTAKAVKECEELPTPGSLLRTRLPSCCEDNGNNSKMCGRQGTYTLSSTPGSAPVRRKNKTSSPIHLTQNNLMDTLVAAQKATEEALSKITSAIQKLNDECKEDSSMSSLVLDVDVSKISVLKGAESSKAQFASSPNLSGIKGPEDWTKNRLRRFESASTSKLDQQLEPKESKFSRLRRISPNIFKKDTSIKIIKEKNQDGKSKLRSLLKPKIITPVRVPQYKPIPEPSPNLSRNKYSHVKSTIPRLAKKE